MHSSISIPSKTKLVAIAKDEGAYIADWVHHHLYFGFSDIDIYVNRTTDNSLNLLAKIFEEYPNVNVYSADWIDYCPEGAQNNLQYIVYSKALDIERTNNLNDYIMFMDIDEFWMPKDMKSSISEVIERLGFPDSISFQWINELGSEPPFSRISKSISGYLHPLVKTVFKVNAKVEKIGFHFPKLNNARSILPDSSIFISDTKLRECIHSDSSNVRDIMIIHRMFRSKREYVSLLNRGRPSDELQIKLNRSGYNKSIGTLVDYDVNAEEFAQYSKNYLQFISNLNLTGEIDAAKKFVLKRSDKTIESIKKVPVKYYSDLLRVFSGGLEEEKYLLATIKSSQQLIKSENVENLIKISIALEQLDLRLSLKIMQIAKQKRPDGPLIKTKLLQYKNKLC